MSEAGGFFPPYDVEGVCECGHGTEEHSYSGCDAYTPTWPRLVRCPCEHFPAHCYRQPQPDFAAERTT